MSRTIFPVTHRAPVLCALLFLAFGLLAALSAPARGAETGEGLFLFAPDARDSRRPAPAVASTADVVVNGITGRVVVRQEFLNPDDAWLEGVYVFPLPADAAVDRMRLRIDGRLIEGRIAAREVAKRRYQAAVRSGHQASLLEEERPNVFTMSVANIPPKGRIQVEIGYQQPVRYQDGRYEIRFPMAVTPRYLPAPTGYVGVKEGGQPPASRLLFPVRDPAAPPSNPVAIKVSLATGVPLGRLESPTDPLLDDNSKAGQYQISLREGAAVSDRDFVLQWTLETGPAPKPALFVERAGEVAYLMAMIVPPRRDPTPGNEVAREAIFVIDTSGSMHGESMRQAKRALLAAIKRLRPSDRFNIIAFSDKTRQLFERARAADEASRDAARSFVKALAADGGTEIGLALGAALKGAAAPGRLRQVVLLTDGAVGNEAAVLARLRRDLGVSRLFTVAIGSAPNGYFMEEAARVGRGASLRIDSPKQVARRMGALFAKLSAPALTDIKMALAGDTVAEFEPTAIPDLYHGEPILVTARLSKAAGEFVLEGGRNGEPWRERVSLDQARPGIGIAKLWARRKVDREMGRLGAGADPDDVRRNVLALALEHGLLTRYTSLVAVDETPLRPAEAGLAKRAVPGNSPAGWTPPNAPKSAMLHKTATVSLGAKTATPAALYGLLGGLLLLLSSGFGLLWRRTA